MKGRGMKRKQFHLGNEEERILRQTAEKYGLSEAEIVREAIKEYGRKKLKQSNPLSAIAKHDFAVDSKAPRDLAANHDRYLVEGCPDEET
jgi:hypothetical protein